jgi:hypothetical protein
MTMTTAPAHPRWLRPLAWLGGAALILLPLLALKLADAEAWEVGDLMFAGIMIALVGAAFELAVRTPARNARGAGTVLAVAAALILTWANGAVGLVGPEDNPINRIYVAIPAAALLGAILARFRPRGLALAMAATAATQVAVGAVALYHDHFTGPLSTLFTACWLAAAYLFHKAAPGRPAERPKGPSRT